MSNPGTLNSGRWIQGGVEKFLKRRDWEPGLLSAASPTAVWSMPMFMPPWWPGARLALAVWISKQQHQVVTG